MKDGAPSAVATLAPPRGLQRVPAPITGFAVCLIAAATACGGEDSTGPEQRVPATLLEVSGDAQQGTVSSTLSSPLVVKVVDPTGAGVTGVTVSWSVIAGGGSISAVAGTTDAIGATSTLLTLGSVAGVNAVTAQIIGLPSIPAVTFNAVGTAAAPARLRFTEQPSAVLEGEVMGPPVRVTVHDAFGNAVSGATTSVTLSLLSAGGANLSGALATAAIDGVASFGTLRVDKPGTYSLAAHATGLAQGNSTPFDVLAVVPTELVFTVQPIPTTAGASITPSVKVTARDSVGRTATTFNGAVTVAMGTNPVGGTLSGTKSVNAVLGVATFSNLSIQKSGTGFTLGATAASLRGATSSAFDILTGPPARLSFTRQPSDVLAGSPFDPAPQVTIQDDQGNQVLGATEDVALSITTANGANLGGTATRAAVGGVATFPDLMVDKAAQGYTLTASASDMSGDTSLVFSVGAGAPTTLTPILGTAQSAVAGTNVAVAPAVKVTDLYGNPVDSLTVLWAIVGGGGSVAPASVTTDSAGVAQVSTWRLGIDVGTNILEASVTGLSALQVGATAVGFMVESVAGGSRTSCALDPAGIGYCWGQNAVGHVGDGTTTDRLTPVAVAGGHTFGMVSVGGSNACGLEVNQAWCWGDNYFGNVGDGSTQNLRTSPVAVVGNLQFQSIESGGGPHNCGLVAGGAAYCWGNNEFGNLGDSTNAASSAPVAVRGGAAFSALTVGIHTCGLTSAGAAYCWGRNFPDGKLGDGTTTDRWVPTQVVGGTTFSQLTAGLTHTCGLTAGGHAYCWGRNDLGQLGDGTQVDRSTPTAVLGGLTFTGLQGGRHNTCGLTADGTAHCWGAYYLRDFNSGTTPIQTVPQPVLTSLKFSTLSGRSDHTCGISLAGAAYCWGNNFFGQLGDGSKIDRLSPVAVRPLGY